MLSLDLSGQAALVTGGSRGIGRAIVETLAAGGAAVALTHPGGAEGEAAAAVVRSVEAGGGRALAIEADVTDRAAASASATAAIEAFGGLDILVNNAGINRDGVVWKLSEDDWNRVLDVDLTGAFHQVQAVVPHLRARGRGRIVNIASINGMRGKFGQANYAAAKGGLIAFTKSVAAELARWNVTVNAVAPGYIATEMTGSMPADAKAAALSEVLLGRPGTPQDVANAVAFLCSDLASHLTAQVLQVDGGQLR